MDARVGPVIAAEGVEVLAVRTPTLPPATHTNAVLFGTEEAVLVEPASPYPEEVDRVVAWVDRRRAAGLVLRAIVVTHHHIDHVGGAVVLRERLGVPLLAHVATAERVAPHVQVDGLLGEGDRLPLDRAGDRSLTVLHTPGHAPGHIVVLDPRTGTLAAGDMVATEGTILIEPRDGDMAAYLASLARLRDLSAARVVPAHGAVVEAPGALFDRYLAHRAMREARVLDALRAAGGASTPVALVPAAYADTPRASWPLAAQSLEAHLVKLEAEGRVVREGGTFRLIERDEAGPGGP